MLRLLAQKMRVCIRKQEDTVVADDRALFASRVSGQARVAERIHIPGVVMIMIVIWCVYGNWNSRRHGSRSGAFQEPSPIHRRLVIWRRHSP
jgi:hypothetical protein